MNDKEKELYKAWINSDEEIEHFADDMGFIQGSGDHPCGFWIKDGDL